MTTRADAHDDEFHKDQSWKFPVRVATTVAGTLASSFENGDTVDGVVLATGDRILIKDQASGSANGIYVVAASGAPARAYDMDTGLETVGSLVKVVSGTTNGGQFWQCTNTGTVTIGTTALTFTQFAGTAAPSGTAGGDLSGTYPNPTVATVGGENASAIASGVHTHVFGEEMVGDGATTLFYLAQEAQSDQAPAAYVSGSRTDVTLGGMNDTITFGSAPSAAASIRVDYIPVTS